MLRARLRARAPRRTRRPGGSRRPLLAAQVAVPSGGGEAFGGEAPGELLGDGHAAVLPPGAAHRERQVTLALTPIAGDQQSQHVGVPVEELRRIRQAEDVGADIGVLAGLWS